MYSDMSMRTIASWESNMNSASARASSVLPTQLGRPLQIGLALGALGLGAGLLQALLDVAHLLDRVLLGLPLRLHRARALAQLGQLALDRLAARYRGLVLLLGQRLVLDLQLHD